MMCANGQASEKSNLNSDSNALHCPLTSLFSWYSDIYVCAC